MFKSCENVPKHTLGINLFFKGWFGLTACELF